MKFHPLIALAVALSTVACAPMPADKPADEPPRLVQRGERVLWENAGAFGPVPQRLVQKAGATCARLNTTETVWTPVGYHPKALGLDGKALAGGGYYCKSRRA